MHATVPIMGCPFIRAVRVPCMVENVPAAVQQGEAFVRAAWHAAIEVPAMGRPLYDDPNQEPEAF